MQQDKTKKILGIIQSNYIPWKGYFDIINLSNIFIIYDEVQYSKNTWRNRNKIKTPKNLQWLTIPVESKGKCDQKIRDVVVIDPKWNVKHWKSVIANYSKAKYFHDYKDRFEELYLGCNEKYLSLINYRFMVAICDMLGIRTKMTWDSEYDLKGGKTEKLAYLCRQTGTEVYLTGPTAKGYLDDELFEREGLKIDYMDYSGYPEYNQLYPPFEHQVSIIDLIFSEGPNAPRFMKSF
jgi:hypothetical protein